MTFHPVTLEADDMPRQVAELAAALRGYDGSIVITAPAPDPGSASIREEMQRLAKTRRRTVFVENLGSRSYRGLLHRVGAMVGNSSSGVYEASCVPLPVVNIGARQQGRDRTSNVLDVPPQRAAIEGAIAKALSSEFRGSLTRVGSLYGDGRAVPTDHRSSRANQQPRSVDEETICRSVCTKH